MSNQSQTSELSGLNEIKTRVEIVWLILRIVGVIVTGILATAKLIGVI